ncbi:MAG TPA: aldo/keto reductase [Patescibacteria group bacterium]|nr:aldo/keto reductase [Patescibacteria group bacterium]
MRYVEAGGVRLSAIGLGTWQFGSTEWGYGSDFATKVAGDIVRRAIELGINLIDTAEIYGFGRSERIVGAAIKGRRDAVFVATKLFPVGLPFMAESRARASARRLGVDRIDLYQQHWQSPLFPAGATMSRLRRLLDRGEVSHVGVSNHDLEAWKRCDDALGAPVISNQVSFSLLQRSPERELVPWAQRNGRVVIAYSPLAQGILSGRYQAARPGNFRRFTGNFSAAARTRREPLIAALRDMAGAHDATAAQVALAWLIRKPNVVAIPGASSVAQLEENARAADLELGDAEVGQLDSLSA